MNRRDDPFERDSWDFGIEGAGSSMASSMVEDLARRDYFLHSHPRGVSAAAAAAAASTSGGGNSPFSDLGAFSSVPPSSSTAFPYSQKNFHISDGNLYSVLSPFQARKSSARPAFLRGQSCVTSTSITSSSSSTCSSSASSSSTLRQEHGSGRRSSKLKFHHQDMPPPYGERSRRHPPPQRCSSRPGDGGDTTAWCEGPSTSSFGKDPFCGLRSDDDFLLSKRLKSPHRTQHFRRTMDDEEDDEATIRHRLFRSSNSSEWKSEDISSRSFRQQHQQQQRHHHRRRSTAVATTTTDSSNSGRSRTVVNNSMVDVDDEEEGETNGPLNLCLADYQRKLESRIKSDFESDCETSREAESDAEGFPFQKWPLERKFGLAELFDGFPTKFSSSGAGGGERFKIAFEDEPRVLDLSMKEHASKSASAFRPSTLLAASTLGELGYGDSFFVQSCQVPPDAKSKRFAPISEMLENMRLQDSSEDFRQNALERYLSARERLVHTHPEMFGGWERERCEPQPAASTDKPPYDCADAKPAFVPKESQLDLGPPPAKVAPDRPRSWDVPALDASSSSGNLLTVPDPVAPTRPESAEPCLESAPFVPAAAVVLKTACLEEGRPVPHGPVLCASCPEVPSMGAAASHASARFKYHPKMKIKSESAIGVTQRPKARPLRKSGSAGGMAPESQLSSSQYTNQDISICKFKLTKGVHPVLEEKKSFFVPMPRPPPKFDEGASCSGMSGGGVPLASRPFRPAASSSAFVPGGGGGCSSAASAADKFRTFKIHVGSQEDMGRKLAGGGNKRLRRRSQKALVREKLEATFREQGFLIKTQQVSSAEGAVYCKFRQLKKFTRYLYKSWKDHLPKELDDISKNQQQQQQQQPVKESS